MSSNDCIEVFAELGLSRLEAEIYVYLLQESPATGYRVAKGIGRSKTNTYKALASLEAKRVILVENGGSRRCRAVRPEELMRRFENGFRERRNRAVRAVRTLQGGGQGSQRPLTSVEDVIERGRAMLDAGRRTASIDAFPGPLAILQPEIEAAAARGVLVHVIAYQPVKLAGVQVVVKADAATMRGRVPGEWIAMAVDGEQQLQAVLAFNGTEVHEASWSASPVLAQAHFGYLEAAFQLAALRAQKDAGVGTMSRADLATSGDGRAPYWGAGPVRIGNRQLGRPPVYPSGEGEVS